MSEIKAGGLTGQFDLTGQQPAFIMLIFFPPRRFSHIELTSQFFS